MLHNYYSILNMVRDGVKLRRVERDGDRTLFVDDTEAFKWDNTCFSIVKEPESIYEYTAYDTNEFQTTELEIAGEAPKKVYYDGNADVNDSYVVLISDFGKFCGLSNYLSGISVPNTLSAGTRVTGDDHTRWAKYCKVVDACIGKINIPASIYNNHIKTPKSMPCADVEEYIAWLTENQSLTGSCCNARLWEDMGGKEMLDFLNASAKTKYNQYRRAMDGMKYSVPFLEVPLLLTQNFTDVGVLTNIDGENYVATNEKRPHNINSPSGFTIDHILMKPERVTYPTTEEYEENPALYNKMPVEVESLLKTLRSNKKYLDDNDNVLPGLFRQYDNAPGGKYIMCQKSGTEWVTSIYTGTDLENGDGMTSEEIANEPVGTKYYRSVTTESAAKRISEVYDQEPKEEGAPTVSVFYYKAKYENSQSKPMKLPYEIGNATNVYVYDEDENIYRGDFIATAPDINGNKIVLRYIIGGYFKLSSDGTFQGRVYPESGDTYYEKHTYSSSHLDYVTLDGVDNVPIWSEFIDFEADAKEFYSPAYNLYRTGTTANIIETTTAEIWNENYSYDAYLTKEEYLTNFSLPPKISVNVTIDRGGATAFESHYKLSECNTMQDLVQYNNGEFFPN
jgi:hypothetical protein